MESVQGDSVELERGDGGGGFTTHFATLAVAGPHDIYEEGEGDKQW